MKTKTIIIAILLLFSLTSFAQQKKELTKEETLTYINDLFKKSTGLKTTYSLDGKTLVYTYEGGTSRFYLGNKSQLKVEEKDIEGKYWIWFPDGKLAGIYALTEEDAKRLKNALEHLIKLLKAEPDTDPFAN